MERKYSFRQLIAMERDPYIQRQKLSSMNMILQIFSLISFALVISPITRGLWGIAIICLLLGTWFFLNDLLLKKIKDHIVVMFITITGTYILSAAQFWLERNMDFGMNSFWQWILIIPFLCDFIGGILYGTIASSGGWILAFAFMWSPLKNQLQEFGDNDITLFPINYLCIMFIAAAVQYKMTSYQVFRKEAEQQLAARQKERVQRMEEQLTIYEENDSNMRKLKHDIRHFNRVIRAYLKDDDIKGALEYIDQIDGKLEEVKNTNYCDNKLINGLLTVYISQAKKINCDVKVKAIVPDKLAIDAIDLTSIIANAIENAAEAVRRVDEEERSIRVTLQYDGQKLKILIKNTCAVTTEFSKDGIPISTKVVKSGIGTRNIQEISEKYGGFASFLQQDNWFITKAIINC